MLKTSENNRTKDIGLAIYLSDGVFIPLIIRPAYFSTCQLFPYIVAVIAQIPRDLNWNGATTALLHYTAEITKGKCLKKIKPSLVAYVACVRFLEDSIMIIRRWTQLSTNTCEFYSYLFYVLI